MNNHFILPPCELAPLGRSHGKAALTILARARQLSLIAVLALVSFPALAVSIPFSEDFQSPAPSSDAAADYPEFTAALNGGSAVVDASGFLQLIGTGAGEDMSFTVPISPSPTDEITIFAQIGASNSNGNYNVGMVVGGNQLVFHPGYGAIPGAFRIQGPGGFGNTSMGFVPANGSLHLFEVHSFPNGDFNIQVTDADNPANVFNTSFNNPASYGGPIGFWRSGPNAGEDGRYDNLQIVPEPSVASALIFGLAALAGIRRRR